MLWCCLCAVLLVTVFLLPSSLGTVFLNRLGRHFLWHFLFSVNHHHHHQHLERSLIPWTITSDRHDGPITATDTSTRQEEKKSCTLLLPHLHICTFTVHIFNLALFNLAHFNLTNLTNRTHVQCLVLLIVAVLVLTTTDFFCFRIRKKWTN